MSSVCIIFGIMSYYDYYWMPNPDLNYLSWSYGFAVLSAFFSFFAGIAQVAYTKHVRQMLRKPHQPMMMGNYPMNPVKDSAL